MKETKMINTDQLRTLSEKMSEGKALHLHDELLTMHKTQEEVESQLNTKRHYKNSNEQLE